MTSDEEKHPPDPRSVAGIGAALWRLRPIITLALGCGVVVLTYVELNRMASQPVGVSIRASGAFVREDPEDRYRSLTGAELQLLRRQRDVVDDLARRHVGSELTRGSLRDLEVLQEILDAGVVDDDERFELQSLGVALGDVMERQLGFSWVVYRDDRGESRALRLDETDLVVFPITMISKRVERGVPFRIDELYQRSIDSMQESVGPPALRTRPVPPERPRPEGS
jgi:hypothetical protein